MLFGPCLFLLFFKQGSSVIVATYRQLAYSLQVNHWHQCTSIVVHLNRDDHCIITNLVETIQYITT